MRTALRAGLIGAGLMVLLAGSASAATKPIKEFSIVTANSGPADMTAGPDGNVWFVDQLSGRIGTVTHTGTVTGRQIPTPKSLPTAIASGPDGALWFTEQATNKIGQYILGTGFREFTIPTAKSG